MKIIGITGGVGAGKSTVLNMLSEMCDCSIIMADDVAKGLMERGGSLEKDALRLFGEKAYLEDGSLNKAYIASLIYADKELLNEWSGLVHPATNEAIGDRIAEAKTQGRDFAFVEAALLIENHYESICDEIWYIYASLATRSERLKESRGYSEEKVISIDNSQLSEEEFRRHCDYVIDTDGGLEETRLQLEKKLEQYTKL